MAYTQNVNESKLQLKDFFTEQEDLEKMRDNLTMRDMERKQAEFDRAQKSAKNAGVKTYGDLSDEEWEAEREKSGYEMKTDAEGNQYIDFKYDGGNEPLEIQMSPDQGEYANKIFYIEPEDIEAYVNGEDVEATNPGETEYDEVTANKQNSDVTPQGEEMLKEKIDDKAALKKSAKGMAMYGAKNEQYSLKDFFTNE